MHHKEHPFAVASSSFGVDSINHTSAWFMKMISSTGRQPEEEVAVSSPSPLPSCSTSSARTPCPNLVSHLPLVPRPTLWSCSRSCHHWITLSDPCSLGRSSASCKPSPFVFARNCHIVLTSIPNRLYGMTLHQLYRYYILYPSDKLWLRWTVGLSRLPLLSKL